MKILIVYLILITISASARSQEIPKKSNTILIKGISFKEAGDHLLDAGYSLDKTDSSFQMIQTAYKEGAGKNKWMRLKLLVRIKDSTATVTGLWYSTLTVGTTLWGSESTVDNSAEKIEYTWGNSKNLFIEMNDFALSFKKPIEYK